MKKCFTCARRKATYVAFIVKTILLFICLSTYSCKIAAQLRFPVSSRSIIKPPYSTALSDYYTGTDPRLQLVLMNMDITQPVIKARLRLNIISNRINLRSREFIGPIVELDAGTPQYLSGMDLSVYFNPNNIDVVSGLDYNALFKTPALPDGTYTFRFDVIEAFTGRILNNIYENQSTINILRCEPPFLNLPRKGDNIRYTDPLNIVFNWTPRALIKGMTEYEFSLYEINDNGMPPENAPFMSQPIYQTTTNTTTFLYSPTEPPLLPGKKYAWRVKAIAKQGIDSYSLYTNNGYTETYWFQLQDNCDPIQQISATVRNGAVTLEWPDNSSMYGYTVEYWKKGDWNRHFSTTTKNNKAIITDVAPGNTYEYRVGGTCTVGAGATYSDIRAFTIPPRDSIRDKQCGMLANINLSNQKILDNLNAGETVMVGDFPVTLLSVMANGNGSFSGTAAVKMDIFSIAEAKVKAKFDNVVFNTDKQLIKGFMVTTYDSTEKRVVDLDEVMEGGGDVGKVKTGKDSTDLSFNFPISKPEDIKVTINTDGTAVINVTGANDETKKITVQNLPTTIKDSEGNIYGVDKHGKVTKVGKTGEFKGLDFKQFNTIATNKATVTFIAHPEQQYAFDAWKDIYNNSQLFQAEYEKLNGYRVSSKAIEAAKTDVVKATIKINDNSIKPDSVRFVTGKGTRYESKYLGNNEYEITVVGGPAKDAQELYAIYPSSDLGGGRQEVLSFGKLLIASYPHQKQKIILVPVNGASVNKNKIADELNKIYNKIAVEFDVQQDANFNDNSWDKNGDGLDVDGSGLFSTLTSEMKALNNAYRNSKRPIDKSTIYLFVLPQAAKEGVMGDMPRGKQFGYLFNGSDGRTVAHEVGHGLFHLKHTFDSQYGFAKAELSDNVMDYSNGNQFSKLQWDAIHDPGLVIGLFESDGDAESATINNIEKLNKFKNADGTFTFLTPSGKPITLKGKLSQVSFVTAEDKWVHDKTFLPIGTLISFELDSKLYSGNSEMNSNKFIGYLDEKTNKYYIEAESIKEKYKNVIIGIPCLKNGSLIFKVFTTNYLDKNTYQKKVSDKNQGEGKEQDIFFLSPYLQNESQAEEIYAQMTPLSDQQLFFLNKYSSDGNLCGMEALYAFRAAHLVGKTPGLLNCLQDAESDTRAAISRKYAEDALIVSYRNGAVDNLRVVIPYKEIVTWKEGYEKTKPESKDFLKYLHNSLNTFQKIIDNKQSAIANLSNEQIGEIIDVFAIDNAKGRTCLLRNLPISLRIELLKKHTSWTITTSKESLMADLIETTPDEDINTLLSFLEDNDYQWLWSLYKDINGGNSDRFVSIVSWFILKTRTGADALQQWPNDVIPPLVNVPTQYLYIGKNVTRYNSDGSSITYNTTSNANGSQLELTSTTGRNTEDIWGNKFYQQYFKGAPFEFVRVRFRSDYRFPLLGSNERIKETDDIIVPAIWVYWLLNRQNTVENWANVRIIVDAGAIILSAATIEPGPLLAAEALMGTADIVFTLKEDKIQSSGTELERNIAAGWDALYAVYGAGLITRSVVNGVVKFSIKPAAIASKVREFKNIPQKLSQFATDINSLLSKIKSINPASFNGRNIFYSFLLSAYLEVRVANFARNVDEISLLVSQGNKVVVKYLNKEMQVADVVEQGTNNILVTNLRWHNESQQGAVVKVVGKLEGINYTNTAGQQVKGDLELVSISNGNVYARMTLNGAGKVFKNIDLATFKKTFTATEEQYAKAYQLWGEEKWDDLYQYFKDNNLNNWNGINWPPFNGAKNIIKIEKGNQLAGKVFDRFQTGNNADKLGGGFASPVLNSNEGVADLIFTYDSRALADRIQEGTYYYKFKIKDIVPANLEFEYGEAIPWFKLQGNADQVKSSMKFGDLKDNIEVIEVLKFERGTWKKIQ